MKDISRAQLYNKMLQQDSMMVVEVLSPESYKAFHLPGAVNVPMNERFEDHIQHMVSNKGQGVVVYCQHTECTASLEAAEKMNQLGYHHVYDYEGGKDDWVAAGFPLERSVTPEMASQQVSAVVA